MSTSLIFRNSSFEILKGFFFSLIYTTSLLWFSPNPQQRSDLQGRYEKNICFTSLFFQNRRTAGSFRLRLHSPFRFYPPTDFFGFFQNPVATKPNYWLRSRGIFLFSKGEQVSPTAANNSNPAISVTASLRQLDGDYAPHALVFSSYCVSGFH